MTNNPTRPDVYKENYEMRKKIKDMEEAFSRITTTIYCIGGPLNDNVLRYSKKQLMPFWRIAQEAEGWSDHE